MLLEVVHETRYAYGAPVSLAHHLAHLQPLDDSHQRLLAHDLFTEPEAETRRGGIDTFGNHCLWFSRAQPHEQLLVHASSRVAVSPRFDGLQPETSPPWDELARSLRYVAQAPYNPAVQFTLPSPYVPRLQELRDYAAPCLPPGRPVLAAAIELMQRVHAEFTYCSSSTEVDTPLAQAFRQRRGVCQDFAHLMAGALRLFGVPARYVSGYLLTRAPGDAVDRLGADASHAWVQVYCAGTPCVPGGWVDLDPTNDLIPDDGHVRLAVGRDFGDVTPLRGVIRGGGQHQLTVAVRTRVIDPGPAIASS